MPLNLVTLYARSFAEEACFSALADLHQVLQRTPQARVIGGMMVTLHTHRWQLPDQVERLTLDNDLGVASRVIVEGSILEDLARAGYTETSGGRYQRAVTTLSADEGQPQPTAIIDVLVPTYTSRARKNIKVGKIYTTEVLGLAEALQEGGVSVAVSLRGKSGWTSDIAVTIPSEPFALLLKAMAWNERMLDKDAFDIWRMLEVCSAADAKMNPTVWQDAEKILQQAFAREDGQAMVGVQKIARATPTRRKQLWTRIRALLKNITP